MWTYHHPICFAFGLLVVIASPVGKASTEEIAFDPSDYSSADIWNSRRPIATKIKHPDKRKNDTILVRCKTHISPAGEFQQTSCNGREGLSQKYPKAIIKAAEKSVAKPAENADKKEEVWMTFSVMFRSITKYPDASVLVFPSHLTDMKQYGPAYIAPQRTLASAPPECLTADETTVELLQEISAEGRIIDITVSEELVDSCQTELNRYQTEARFIPAVNKLHFVPATIDEYILPKGATKRVGNVSTSQRNNDGFVTVPGGAGNTR
jgi:hypothetical protein